MPTKTVISLIFFVFFIPGVLSAQTLGDGVVINEIMYAPHSPEPEWIELFNTDSVTINLTKWQIFTTTRSATLPAVSIAAKGYLVITKDSLGLIGLRPGSYPIAQMPLPDLNNAGSELILRDSSLRTIDSLDYMPSWGGSSGSSLERRNVLKSSTDPTNWGTSQAATGATPGARNSIATLDSTPTVTLAHPLDIVMNEIMFAPVSPEPEWIELMNTTHDTINIAGWVLSVQGHSPITFPSTNTFVAPDSLVVLSSNDAALASARMIPLARIVKCSVPNLNNNGSTLAIRDPLGNLIDSAYYNGNWIKADGISIERIDPSRIGYDSTNWSACNDPSGSTILRPNSDTIRGYDLALTNTMIEDTSIEITIMNVGRDTIRQTTLALQIGSFTPSIQPLSINLPRNSSVTVTLGFAQTFYGLFPATVYLDDALDKNHTNDTIRFSVAPPIPQDSLVINEIMFDPLPTSCQWLEIYNLTSKWISLDSTRLITGEKRPAEYSHEIPPPSPTMELLIAPDSFGIITANDSIYSTYPALNTRNGIGSTGISSLDLGKDSCFVVLHNYPGTLGSTIDSVHYFKTWQQSLFTKTFVGISLERKDPHGESSDANNWQASLDSATPLARNSVATSDTTSTPPPTGGPIFAASFSPNPFSLEDDRLQYQSSTLTVQTGNSSQWVMQVRIFDARGRLVRTLTNAMPVSIAATLLFDGKRDNGQSLPPGLYTVLVELTSQNPIQTLKQETGVVIAGKRR
jgi:hypothetical protein